MSGSHPRAQAVASTLIRQARLVPVGSPVPTDEPVDLRIRDGVVREVAARLGATGDEEVVDAGGRWAIPGLWDQHVHMVQWAQTLVRLDLRGTSSPAEVTRIVGDHIAQLPAGRRGSVVSGFGHRSATWSQQPTVAELDAVSGDHPVVLVSGDGHSGWLNSRALALFGVPPRSGPLDENDWFPIFARLGDLPGAEDQTEAGYHRAVQDAAAKGIVGVVDMEFGPGWRDWPERFARGIDQLRTRPATYPDRLDEVLAAGLHSGQELSGGGGLLTMGPLKIVSDGSLNTRTAYCHQPYADAESLEFPRGKQNYRPEELTGLVGRAHAGGLEAAVHAIGDAAVATALDAFQGVGASGSIEHAQLMAPQDITRMGRLGVRASVQPAHLLDDRDVTQQCWPDRADRCFPLRSLLQAGVTLAMGSDAPVAPLDPWLAMAAAVHRSADEREPWNPAQALTAAEALAASTDGQETLAASSRGDVVLLDDDPLGVVGDSAAVAEHLRACGWPPPSSPAGRPTCRSESLWQPVTAPPPPELHLVRVKAKNEAVAPATTRLPLLPLTRAHSQPGSLLPGLLAATRTGPHRLATTSLPLDQVCITSNALGALPSAAELVVAVPPSAPDDLRLGHLTQE
ncbi:MAG TPA: amidohydrolase [Actinomycetota bacterium]|nr:amidohydrolase [Actinomycetota bacterium]